MRFLLGLAFALILAAPAQAQVQVVGQRSGGVLRFPLAVAVGPDGSVYVGDQYSHAVQVFGPDGTFKREIGATANGPGGLRSIGGVAGAARGSGDAAP